MQRVFAWLGLVVIVTIVAVIDPRSLISVFVCIAPILARIVATPKSRQQSKEAEQLESIER